MTAVGPCKRLTALMTQLMAILYPPHTLQCDLAASPIKSGNLFPHSLNLSWPCDLLCSVECGIRDNVSVLNLALHICTLNLKTSTSVIQ